MKMPFLIVLILGIFLCAVSAVRAADGYGLLEVRSAGTTRISKSLSVCIVYNSEHQSVPSAIEELRFHHLVDLSRVEGCSPQDLRNPPSPIENSTVAVMRGNCSFTQKGQLVQSAHGSAVLVVDYKNSTQPIYPKGNASEFQSFNITLATIGFNDYMKVLNMSESVVVALYAPPSPIWDANMVLIIVLSTLLVMAGAAWSAYDAQQFPRGSRHRASKSEVAAHDDKDKSDVLDEISEISVLSIVIWFVLICGMILMLYFFYDYMVYFFIAMFCIMGSHCLYKCLLPLWSLLLPITYSIPANRLPCIQSKVKLRSVLLLILCLTVGIFWAIHRHASYAWALQDLLGAAFCIYFIHTLRLPNLKVITVLLVLLLVYDVFFVFITPLFTSDGHSIMESVASGGRSHSKESLPMVFLLPTLSESPIGKCTDHKFSLLGFGDVIIPGLLVAYNAVFDVKTGNCMVYFICSSIGYFVGMIVCIVSLMFMNTGQPALLYLVPGTLFTTIVVALVRKELLSLFLGQQKQPPKVDDSIESRVVQNEEGDFNDYLDEEQRNLIN